MFKFRFHAKKSANCKPKKCDCMQKKVLFVAGNAKKMFICIQINMQLHNLIKYYKQNQNKIKIFKKYSVNKNNNKNPYKYKYKRLCYIY